MHKTIRKAIIIVKDEECLHVMSHESDEIKGY
jgi:hypothetical protein